MYYHLIYIKNSPLGRPTYDGVPPTNVSLYFFHLELTPEMKANIEMEIE